LRGQPYNLGLDEVARRVREAWERGATEVCLQGGIHPDFTGHTYLDILKCVKEEQPAMHVHAFSALEVWHGASTLGLPVTDYLEQLRQAGLGSLPGTAAEVLDDQVREIICPDKITTQEWLSVIEAAHRVGLRTTSTLMFGHVEGPGAVARHLLRLRALQRRTAGITEFVPLPFVHNQAPMYLRGEARQGPSFREAVLVHAVARLALFPVRVWAVYPHARSETLPLRTCRARKTLWPSCRPFVGAPRYSLLLTVHVRGITEAGHNQHSGKLGQDGAGGRRGAAARWRQRPRRCPPLLPCLCSCSITRVWQ
jgi:2-iminoacetate synthase ThiH